MPIYFFIKLFKSFVVLLIYIWKNFNYVYSKMNSVYQFIKENHMLAVIELAQNRKAFTLNLSRFEIKEIPDLVTTCNTLMKLYLDHNEIIKLPDNIINLTRLHSLTLDYNCLKEFPMVVCELTGLKYLNLSCNDIKTLPPQIGHLTSLQVFWCNNTNLQHIPEEIGNCELIETFGVRGNEIKQLPESIGLLKKLTWLTLENNQIDNLPGAFVALSKLVHLNLKKNQLKAIPKQLVELKKLQYCFLNCNQIDNIDEATLDKYSLIKLIDLEENPIDTTLKNLISSKCKNINFENKDSNRPSVIQNDDSDEEDVSDWENSIETSDIDTNEETGDEHDPEDISVFIPALAKYITTFN